LRNRSHDRRVITCGVCADGVKFAQCRHLYIQSCGFIFRPARFQKKVS
jgi:uncharacterized protein YfaQ (DUF2300 family)